MPVLRIDRVVSFSSEDAVHIANNVLGNNSSLKWKCKSPGEKNAVLCLQLEAASQITGIDIGNEHSAYIEVLVSRSCESEADYKTLLVMSAFMSATEARQSTNINKVRMFKKEDLSTPECDQKWDRVKIVCTQPFNKHVQYGLSFIKFHTNEVDRNDNSDKETVKKIGKFTLRPDSPDNLTAGSLFAKRKELAAEKEMPLTAAAAIRAATSSLLNDTGSTPIRNSRLLPNCLKNSGSKKKNDSILLDDTPLKPRNRKELLYTEDEEKPNAKIDKLIEKKRAEQKMKQDDAEDKTAQTVKKRENKKQEKDNEKAETSKKNTPNGGVKVESTIHKKEKTTTKRKFREKNENSPKKTKLEKETKPFNRLLEGVVLVISGIQNPDRAILRGKLLEMGGKYKSDWDGNCTHLVCAFMNTPKFHQVKGLGKIVTRQWVEECHSQRKKLPWRRFALDKYEKDKDESENEIWEEVKKIETITSAPEESNEPDDFEDSVEEASDTEDIVEQIKNSALRLNNGNDIPSTETKINNSQEVINDPYSADTDTDEETTERKQQLKNKPFDFFKEKTFFIDTTFEDYITEMLKNYIFIHDGSLSDDPTENIDYIICGKEEAQSLNDSNSSAVCILPDWIVDCHKCRQFIPPDEYFIL